MEKEYISKEEYSELFELRSRNRKLQFKATLVISLYLLMYVGFIVSLYFIVRLVLR